MPKKPFKQITQSVRVRVEVLLASGTKPSHIAAELGYDRSAIGREIAKGQTSTGYSAIVAQYRHDQARQKSKKPPKLEGTRLGNKVVELIERGFSPETISGRLQAEIKQGLRPAVDYVSHEAIYQFVYDSDFGQREELYQYLKRGKKHRTRKFGRRSQHEVIPNRVSIEDRPLGVLDRSEFGHWEGDSVIYPYKEAVYTLAERKIRYTSFTKLERKTAAAVSKAVAKQLAKLPHLSLTVDNGKEHYRHEEMTARLEMPVYFAHAYCSWEKGSVENTNGLLRRYLPRGKSILDVTQEDLDDIAWELNNRPRKVLGYFTPQEMLDSELTNTKPVAIGV